MMVHISLDHSQALPAKENLGTRLDSHVRPFHFSDHGNPVAARVYCILLPSLVRLSLPPPPLTFPNLPSPLLY